MFLGNGKKEADELRREATKLVTPGFFKMKGDWMNATPMFERAAMLYRQAKDYNSARECYEKASTGQIRQKSPWHAAKNLEKAGEMANELKDWPGVEDCFTRSAELYCEEGRQSNASEALSKAARFLEDVDPQAAAKIYEQAIDFLEDGGKDVIAGDMYRQAIGFLIRQKMWHHAVSMLTRFAVSCDKAGARSSQCKAYLGAVIVWLYAGDAKQAWNTYQDALSVDCFLSSDEAFGAEALLDSYRTADADTIKAAIASKHCFTSLDNQVQRLVKKLPAEGTDLAVMAGQLGGQAALGHEDEEEDLT